MVSSTTLPPETDSKLPPDGEGHQGEPSKSQLDEIADLLAGKSGDGDGDGDDGEGHQNLDGDGDGDGKPGESQKKGKPKTLKDLAERTGLDVKDLYGIEFELGSGESRTRTIGELKDALTEQDTFEVERLTFAEDKTKTEAGFLKAQSELQSLIELLPKNAIKPELINAIKDQRELVTKRERSQTLTAIPEWSDEDVEKTDRDEMREHLGEYGYAANHLDFVVDHRMLKYIRDNMQRTKRIRAALEKVKRVPTKDQRPSGRTSKKKTAARRSKPNTQANQVAAVAELLNS